MNAPIQQTKQIKTPATAFSEPWSVSDDFIYDARGNLIADLLDDREAAKHAVACVNACRGLDPAFVPELVKVMQKVVSAHESETAAGRFHNIMLQARGILELVMQVEGT